MKAEDLKTGTVLTVATATKTTRTVQDFRPAALPAQPHRQWLVHGQWLSLAEVDARYTLYKPKPANQPA